MPSPERVHTHQRAAEKRKLQKRTDNLKRLAAVAVLAVSGVAGFSLLKSAQNQPQGTDFSEINDVYPEIANLQVKEMGTIQLAGITVKWLNFSNATFDQDKAQKVYEYYQQVLERQFENSFITGQNVRSTFIATARQKNERVLVLVPESAPSPQWAIDSHNGGAPNEAATTGMKDSRPYDTSFIRIFDSESDMTENSSVFTTVEKAVNRSLFVEICQSLIDMKPVNPVDSIYTIASQEITCNSFGATLAAKIIGLSYDEYLAWMGRVKNIKPLIFTRDQYNEMPILEFPIKTKN